MLAESNFRSPYEDLTALFGVSSGSVFDRVRNLSQDKLAFVEIDDTGKLITVSPIAQIFWGWKRGSELPDDLHIALSDLEAKQPVQLPLKMGGLHMGAVKRATEDGWFIFGYAPEDLDASATVNTNEADLDRSEDDLLASVYRSHPDIMDPESGDDLEAVSRRESENVILETARSASEVLEDELERSLEDAEQELRRIATTAPDHAIFCDSAMRFILEGLSADRVYLMMLDGNGQLKPYAESGPHEERDEDHKMIRDRLFEFRQMVADHGAIHIDRGIATDLCEALVCTEAIISPISENARPAGFLFVVWTGQRNGTAIHDLALMERTARLSDVFELLYSWIASNTRFRDTIVAIDDAIFSFRINPDYTRSYIFITHQLDHLTGFCPTEIVRGESGGVRWMRDVVHKDDRSLVRANNMTLRDGHESRIVYRIYHRDGTVRWLREHATPSTDSAGILTVSGILTDVSEMKAAEEVLLAAKKEAEAAANSKTAFIATMSHEIRTPLGAMSGYAQLLDKELSDFEERIGMRLPDQVREFVDVLTDQSQKLQGLVQDLFELSNLEMGKVALQKLDVRLHELIEKAASKVRPLLEKKGVKLHLLTDDRGPAVKSDPRRLEQILDNVLSNAVKFTEMGSVTIRTSYSEKDAVIEIEDTGIGISKEYQGELFDAFSQEENWRTRKFEGTGLGLALSRRLLDLLGGRIEVESEKGNGSLFRITLPLDSAAPLPS